jgi:flagellar FliJ protein
MSGTASFQFRLERIRALREHREDAAKQELAGAIVRHRQCENQMEAAEQRVQRAHDLQLAAGTDSASATDLISRQAYLERVETALRATRQDLDRHARELAGRRDALTAAARDRQSLERLKEQRFADHQRETNRLEGLALDEIAAHGFRRRVA